MQIALEKLKEQLIEFVFLSPKEILLLASIIKFKQVAKGEHIVKADQNS